MLLCGEVGCLGEIITDEERHPNISFGHLLSPEV